MRKIWDKMSKNQKGYFTFVLFYGFIITLSITDLLMNLKEYLG